MEKNNNTQTIVQYIQFSKLVTKWSIILVSFTLLICLAVISFFNLSQDAISVVGKLYASYIAVMSITVGAYQGNSSLEKWTKAKYGDIQKIENGSQNQKKGE